MWSPNNCLDGQSVASIQIIIQKYAETKLKMLTFIKGKKITAYIKKISLNNNFVF